MSTSPQLAFEPTGHKYFYGQDEIPALTRILEEMGFGGFYGLPAVVMAKIEHKRLIGDAVAKACEMWDKGEEMEELHPEVQPYFDAYQEFSEKYKPRTRFNEPGWDQIEQVHLVNCGVLGGGSQVPVRFACRLDRAGIIEGEDHLGVVEIKCTFKKEKYHRLQTAAQGMAVSPERHLPRFALYLDKTGKYKLDPHKDHSQDLMAWKVVLMSWFWRQEYGGK